jgi:hypothetical protein
MNDRMSKLKIALASGALALCMLPNVGWSTRAFVPSVSGQITALPGGDEIEVGSRTYHIKKGSAAEKTLSQLSTGQQVQLTFDGPPGSSNPQVIAITATPES